MTKESDEFESLISRITTLLNGTGAIVERDANIEDPDSPGKTRQIDVLIKKNDGQKIAVECRKRKNAQSVMWIEELIGRKQSLDLDGMIGVSSSGFSLLAQTKAKRFGIILYDTEKLTDDEIISWSEGTEVEVKYVCFNQLQICASIDKSLKSSLSNSPKFCYENKDGYLVVMDRIRGGIVPGLRQTNGMYMDPSGFFVDQIPLTNLSCIFSGFLKTEKLKCVSVTAIGEPSTSYQLRDVTVENFEHSVKEIIKNDSEAHIVIDTSNLKPPPDSILHEFKIVFSRDTQVKKYEIIGNRTFYTPARITELLIVA